MLDAKYMIVEVHVSTAVPPPASAVCSNEIAFMGLPSAVVGEIKVAIAGAELNTLLGVFRRRHMGQMKKKRRNARRPAPSPAGADA
jgi:hypothetical protein